jgi:hypothetical protein
MVGDSAAMLFNLSQQRHFPLSQQAKWAIYGNSIRGPWFTGDGGGDLSAYSEPFNGDNKCVSYANKPGYKIPL